MRKDDDDDDFFHVTCQVEASLREKIQHDDFMELDKLLPKERCGGNHVYKDR